MTNLSPKDKEKLFNEICEYQHIVSHKDAAMELANQYSEQIAIGFAEWAAKNYHHSCSLKGEHFWEEKNLPRMAGNKIESTIDIYKKFNQ